MSPLLAQSGHPTVVCQCLLLAQSGHCPSAAECPLLGVKQTSLSPAVDQHSFENSVQICEGVLNFARPTDFGPRGVGPL
jgi:hypothetical protein